jgi:uncharacterized protein (DUF2141 family)
MKIIATVILLLSAISGQAQSRFELTVLNVKDTTGMIRAALFKDEKTFLEEPFIGKIVKAVKGEVTIVFEDVPDGKYGVSVYHDENKNGELDKNIIGIPREGFAFGNDSMGMFGPPDFEEAGIVLKGETKMSVTMKYM